MFVAAVLTILGFSINDTVVVYDRIRENLQANPSLTFAQVVNPALNSTFSRPIITSLTAVVLYIFGGETLRSFSYAMIVGVVFGTYSTLFIATPIVLDTSGRQGDAAGNGLDAPLDEAPRLSSTAV